MFYEFEDTDGNVVEIELSIAEAPDFGAVIEVDGKLYRRIPSVPTIACGMLHFPRVESRSEPRYIPGNEKSEAYWKGHKGGFSPEGKPRFHNRDQVDEYCKRAHDRTGDEVQFGVD